MIQVFSYYRISLSFAGEEFSPLEFEKKMKYTFTSKHERGQRVKYLNKIASNGWGILQCPLTSNGDSYGDQEDWCTTFIRNNIQNIRTDYPEIEEIEVKIEVFANDSINMGWSHDFLGLLAQSKIDLIVETHHVENEKEAFESLYS